MAKAMLTVAAAVLTVGAAIWYVPALTRDEVVVSSTPSPPPVFEVAYVTVKSGQRACMDPVTLNPTSEITQLRVVPLERGGAAMRFTAEAPGYRDTRPVPAGYEGNALFIPFSPPARPVEGRICIENLDDRTATLLATAETRTKSRPVASIDGRDIGPNILLTFFEEQQRPAISRVGAMFRHANTLTPEPVGPWLMWTLAILIVIGAPACIFGALYLSLRRGADHR